jgi:hypothetical protein
MVAEARAATTTTAVVAEYDADAIDDFIISFLFDQETRMEVILGW